MLTGRNSGRLWIFLSFLVVSFSLSAPCRAEFHFDAPYLSFDVGSPRTAPGPHIIAPFSGVAIDLNGDGHLDVATANYSDATVSVLFGSGNGRLGGKVDLPIAKGGVWIRAADLDLNGGIDLAIACSLDSVVTVLWNAGDGTFPGRTDLHLSGTPTAVALADLQGSDPYPDIAVATDQGTTWVFRNVNGFFNVPSSLSGSGAGAGGIAAADMNVDGLNDLVVTSQASSQVSVFLGQGNARFDPPSITYVSGNPRDVLAVDLDQDGFLDVVTGTTYSVAVLKGNGNGTFQSPATYALYYPGRLASGDFNSDGALDIAVSQGNPEHAVVFLGNGNGTLQSAASFLTGDGAIDVVPADLDEDGNLDLVMVSHYDEAVDVLHGNGNGSFGADRFVGMSASSLAGIASDLDGDGWPDLLAVRTGVPGGVNLRLNPYGSFAPEESYPSNYGEHNIVKTGDLNGDGLADVVLGSTQAKMTVLLGTGGGAFGPGTSYYTWLGPTFITIGDLNGDGYEDVLDAHSSLSSVWLSNSSGQLEWLDDVSIGRPIALGDFNQDGKLDLVGGSYPQQIAFGNGDGSFGTPSTIYYGSLTDLQVANLNGDPYPDLVANSSSAVYLLLGNGLGDFPVTHYYGVDDVSKVGLGDFDRDGFMDFAAPERFRGIVKLYRGNGDGTFDYDVDIGTGDGGSGEVSVQDFNRDGGDDVALFANGGSGMGYRLLFNLVPAPVGVPPSVLKPLSLSLVSNPARGKMGIQFELAEPGQVRVEVLDLAGRRIAILADQSMTAGPHTLTWNGDSSNGRTVAAGMYVVRMAASGNIQARKAIWLSK